MPFDCLKHKHTVRWKLWSKFICRFFSCTSLWGVYITCSEKSVFLNYQELIEFLKYGTEIWSGRHWRCISGASLKNNEFSTNKQECSPPNTCGACSYLFFHKFIIIKTVYVEVNLLIWLSHSQRNDI